MKKTGMMMRIAMAALMAVAVGILAGSAMATEVTSTPIKILPERNVNVRQLSYWESETEVTQGQLMRWGNNAYWAGTAGTTGETAPTFTSGSETNGTAVLRYITPGARRGFVLQLHDDGNVWARAYAAPVPESNGFLLSGKLSHWSEQGSGCPQGAIYIASESNTNTVSAMEW